MDPTVDGPLSAAAMLLHGPIARLLIATFLVGLAVAARRGLLPRWVLTGNLLLAVVNVAMIPSVFFGTDAAFVYAANGWGSVAAVGAVDMIWFGVLGLSVLRGAPTRPMDPAVAPRTLAGVS